jgi:putative iron-regulated protein
MKLKTLSLAVIIIAYLAACSEPVVKKTQPLEHNIIKLKQLLETNADIAFAVYSDSVETLKLLKNTIVNLKFTPTEKTLAKAKKAWLIAREPYGQTEVYRFRLSPIDSTDYINENGPEGAINAWPLGEALIDYVKVGNDFGDDQLGVAEHKTVINKGKAITTKNLGNNIINNRRIKINNKLFSKTVSSEDERDVLAGYHAIEFLLWGQDLNNYSSANTQGNRQLAVKAWGANNIAMGGKRPVSDFISTKKNDLASRRLQYLKVATDKLINDLEIVRDAWEQNYSSNYRRQFTQIVTIKQAKQKIAEILIGMGTLSEGELAGERMQIALSSDSQEDEHSCFSDNTHRDIWLNAQGVTNSYYGEYAGYDSNLDGKIDAGTKIVGYGFDDYLKDIKKTNLAINLETQFKVTQKGYQAIDASAKNGVPVDVMIQSPSENIAKPMRDTIVSLNKQSAQIARLAKAMKITNMIVDTEASACDTSNPTKVCD